MTNQKLKSIIEQKQNVKIKLSSYKCWGFEGYASAKGLGGECEQGEAFGQRTRHQATKAALIDLARQYGMDDLASEVSNDNKRINDIDFKIRTNN